MPIREPPLNDADQLGSDSAGGYGTFWYVVMRIDAGGPPVGAGSGAGGGMGSGERTVSGSEATIDLIWSFGIRLKSKARSLGLALASAAFTAWSGAERSVSMMSTASGVPTGAVFSLWRKVSAKGPS